MGGGGGQGPPGGRLVRPAPGPGPPAASAPPPPSPYLQRPAPPLPRSLGSGETAAGAWERAAPAGVGLRRRGSRGTAGPWEPGTRKRRAAEVGEGRRRAPALASLPAASGSPLGRGRSHFQAGRKVPGAHPCPAAGRTGPHSARRRGARLRTLRSTCCVALCGAAPQRGHARVLDPRALAARDSRAAPPQRTRTLREKGQRGRGPAGAGRALTRCGASGQVRRGGGPPDPGTHPAAPGFGSGTAPSRHPVFQRTGRGGRRDGAGQGCRGGPLRRARDAGVEPSPPGREQGRCASRLVGVEGRGANCRRTGGNA